MSWSVHVQGKAVAAKAKVVEEIERQAAHLRPDEAAIARGAADLIARAIEAKGFDGVRVEASGHIIVADGAPRGGVLRIVLEPAHWLEG